MGPQGVALRVLPVPSAHRYVRHLLAPEGDPAVVLLPDPPVPDAPAGQWWPPPTLDPAVLAELAPGADVVHLHFGFEGRTVAQLREWVAAAADLDLPWVLTVHDLTNPHLHDQSHHRAQLDVLVPAADEVLTLTPGAAAEIGQRWRRAARVVPHPHMLDLERVGLRPARTAAPEGRPLRVGVHLKSLRASTDPRVVTALEAACREPDLADPAAVDVLVLVHDDVRDPEVLARLDAVAARGRVRVVRTRRLDDAALHAHLAALDVSVLPYRWGTHSGWLEECHDLGTHVLAPRLGHFVEQGPAVGYDVGPDGPVPASLAAALRVVRDAPPRLPSRADRLAQRREVAAAHREIWTQSADPRSVSATPAPRGAGVGDTERVSTNEDEGRRRHYGVFYGLDPVPSTGRPLLAVLGNCQAESLRITATTTVDGTPFDSVRVPPVHELTAEDLPHLHALLPRLDVLAAQPVREGYRGLPLGTEEVRPLLRADARLVLLPVLRDPSAYPYQVLVRGEAGDPPVVPYHDLRTLAAAAGLRGGPHTLGSEQLAEAYRDIAREGPTELARRAEAHGTIRADDLVAQHPGEGWTINHPGNEVLIGVGARLREVAGVPAPAADPGRWLLRSIRTPLQPDVVEAVGLPQEPRTDWLVGEDTVTDEEVVATQAAWYDEHPEMVAAGVERHADRLRRLGWSW